MPNGKITDPTCDDCGESQRCFKLLKRIVRDKKKVYLCSGCYAENRARFREQTIDEEGIKDELRLLDNKRKAEWSRERSKKRTEGKVRNYVKKDGIVRLESEEKFVPRRYRKKSETLPTKEESPIEIKGSKLKKYKPRTSSFLTLQESQDLLRIFMSMGRTFKEAKEEIVKVKEQLKETRKKMSEENKTKEEIVISKEKMLEGLR